MARNSIPAPPVGEKFPGSRWKVLEVIPGKPILIRVICECGAERLVQKSSLVTGGSKSCGCWRDENRPHTHGHTRGRKRGGKASPEYIAWQAMIRRCTDPSHDHYARYGGAGVTVCDRWLHSFENFLADMGHKPTPKHTIDRFPNGNGHYRPDNCRWATWKEQARNRKSNTILEFNGERRCCAEWAEIKGIHQATLLRRLHVYGWSIERALTESVHNNGRKKHS